VQIVHRCYNGSEKDIDQFCDQCFGEPLELLLEKSSIIAKLSLGDSSWTYFKVESNFFKLWISKHNGGENKTLYLLEREEVREEIKKFLSKID
jgi:hypothetical protein